MRDGEVIVKELDALHEVGHRAFLDRNIEAYRELFTEDLRYVQPDGTVIDRGQLMRDVSKQLARFRFVETTYTRESLTVNDNGSITQILEQTAQYSESVFIFFTKTWHLKRQGKYTYLRTDNGWRIARVEVLAETVL